MSLLSSKGLDFLLDNEPVVPSAGAGSGELSVDDMVDFLNTDDKDDIIPLEPEPSKPKGKEEKPKGDEADEGEEPKEAQPDEEPDELKQIEEELEVPTEDELELVTPVRRREILAKYPQLFKDFPYLEKAYYREQQFTEIFPTIQDAREASDARKTLDGFETDVMQGNIFPVMKTLREQSPEGFNRMADSLLDMVKATDEGAYYHILGTVSKATIVAMAQEAQKSNNETLKMAAQILNQFLFGTSDFQPPTKLAKEEPKDTSKDTELQRKEREFVQRQFSTISDDLDTRVENTLTNTITAHIDPKGSMTDYIRTKATDDALQMLRQQIANDRRFQTLKDKLWEKAFQTGFKPDDIARIKSAYLAKAKSLLPAVIRKARADALRGMGRKASEDTPTHEGPVTPGRPRSQQPSGKVTKPTDIPKGMSTLEFLNKD